jgi:hypothetical protein
MTYDCSRLDQVEHAARYLIQRGLPRAAGFGSGPVNFTTSLDPTATGYNDFMTLTAISLMTCGNYPTLNVDGLGVRPILRNDGQPLLYGDIVGGKPFIIAYFAGAWYLCGLAQSQVPIIAGSVDLWIRTDGNDSTGDGSANTPDKAFATIDGAWAKAGGRYASTPLFTMNFRLGIPGTYRGGAMGPFGGNVSLTGDINAPSQYILTGRDIGNNNWASLAATYISEMRVSGVTLNRDAPPPYSAYAAWVGGGGGRTLFDHCIFDTRQANPSSAFLNIGGGSAGCSSDTTFYGRGLPISALLITNYGGLWAGGGFPGPVYFDFIDCPITSVGSSMAAGGLSEIKWDTTAVLRSNNVTGPQYMVTENSIITMHGNPCPGTVAGSQSNGGLFIP